MVQGPGTPRRTSQSFKGEIEVFTGFKPAIEACYLSWDDYPVPGVTYTQVYIRPLSHTFTASFNNICLFFSNSKYSFIFSGIILSGFLSSLHSFRHNVDPPGVPKEFFIDFQGNIRHRSRSIMQLKMINISF